MSENLTELGAAFERDGFVVVPNLFSREEVKTFKAEIQRVMNEVKGEVDEGGGDPDALFKSGVYVGLAARSDIFRGAVADARLLDILEACMGPEIEFISDKVVFKNPKAAYASPWHQDWPYWFGSHKLSVWVPLDDATVENGTLRVIPGTHKTKYEHYDPADGKAFTNRIHEEELDIDSAVTAELEAGGAVFFHDLAVHGSHASSIPSDRWVWIPTYRDAQEGKNDPVYAWAKAAVTLRGSEAVVA